MGRKEKQLTASQIGEIRARVKTKQGSVSQIARDFNISRQYIYDLLSDPRYESLETTSIEVIDSKLRDGLANRLETMVDRVLTKIDSGIESEDDLRKLNDLLKNLSNLLQLSTGRPTEIKETRKILVDYNELLKLSPEQRSLYLMGKLPDKEETKDE